VIERELVRTVWRMGRKSQIRFIGPVTSCGKDL
jgi:hypothetical protein